MITSLLVSSLVFLSGVINIWSSLNKPVYGRIIFLEEIYPISLIHISRTLSLVFGFFLIYLAMGIYQRKERSWYLSVVLTIFSIIFHLLKGFDFEEASIIGIILIVLIRTKEYFTVKSSRSGIIKKFKLSFLTLFFLFLYSTLGFYIFNGQFTNQVSIKNIAGDYVYSITGVGKDTLIPRTRLTRWFEDSITTVGLLSILIIVFTIFDPFDDPKKPTENERQNALRLLKEYRNKALSYYSLMDDKDLFFSQSGLSFLQYKVSGRIAVVLGEPIGYQDEFKNLIISFDEYCRGLGITACYYDVDEEFKEISGNSFKFIPFGEDALINLKDFDIEVPAVKDLRYSYNKLSKNGYEYVWKTANMLLLSEIDRISFLYNDWLRNKNLPNIKFSMNYYPLPPMDYCDVLMVYDNTGNLQAFYTFFPYDDNRGRILDLMVRKTDSQSGTSEGALAEAVLHYKNAGMENLNLGMAPLSSLIQSDNSKKVFKRVLINNINRFYGVTSLFRFKKQFNPQWQKKYLAFKRNIDLPNVPLALMRVHMGKKGSL